MSTAYAQPWYQKNVVPTKLAETEVTSTPVNFNTGTTTFGTVTLAFNESLTRASSPMRVTPDVSALADPSTGVAVGEHLFGPDNAQGVPGPEKFYLSRIGGTSVASPIFAGIEADAQQAAGQPIGFANPAIYGLDARSSGAFHNITDNPNYHVLRAPVQLHRPDERDAPAGDLPSHTRRGRLHRLGTSPSRRSRRPRWAPDHRRSPASR